MPQKDSTILNLLLRDKEFTLEEWDVILESKRHDVAQLLSSVTLSTFLKRVGAVATDVQTEFEGLVRDRESLYAYQGIFSSHISGDPASGIERVWCLRRSGAWVIFEFHFENNQSVPSRISAHACSTYDLVRNSWVDFEEVIETLRTEVAAWKERQENLLTKTYSLFSQLESDDLHILTILQKTKMRD